MKKAFTMIELVFVIVIIGIVASVAIPKLSATRDDAEATTIISNVGVAFQNMAAYYTAMGRVQWKNASLDDATHVLFTGPNCTDLDRSAAGGLSPYATFTLCDNEDTVCINFETTDDGNLTITSPGDSIVCNLVRISEPIYTKLKTFQLGASSVNRD